jgi:hypothetical protein
LLFLLIYSCEKDELDFIDSSAEEIQNEENFSNFRRKVENPYTISNMQMALDSITKRVKGGKLKSATGKKAAALKTKSIAPNMLYIQFTPKTLEQEGLLKQDSTLALIDYPLGYEYQDAWFKNRAKLKEGEIPTYYTSVAIDRKLPKGVPHKVLAEMYLPQEDKSMEGRRSLYRNSNNEIGDLVDVLLNQAFKQTGNEGLDGLGILKKEGEAQSESKFLGIGIGSKWHPEGTLRIWDDHIGSTTKTTKTLIGYETYPCRNRGGTLYGGDDNTAGLIPLDGEPCTRPIWKYKETKTPGSYVPLEGAQVLLRDTFTIGNEITNSDGYFSFDRLRGNKRYCIQWERYEYSIRDGSLWQAIYRGPKKNSRWDHDIKGGDDEYFANIHRAAHFYYYGDIGGLTEPPNNSFWNTQMKIGAFESDGASAHVQQIRYFGVLPRIYLNAYEETTEQTIGETIHELAHAAHWRVDKTAYNDLVYDAYAGPWLTPGTDVGPTERNNRRLLESWATGVEIYLTRRYYRTQHSAFNYEYQDTRLNGTFMGNYQSVEIDNNRGQYYTSVFWDMLDTFNQRTDFGRTYRTLPLDNVSGFTMPQLENALKNAEYWSEYKNNVINQNTENPTVDLVPELFANWE